MSLQASIIAKLKLNNEVYDVNLDIPSAAPTAAAPYHFAISQEVTSGDPVVLLDAVIGDASHFYVAVTPPEAVLNLTGDIIESLSVVVNEGAFDPKTGKFPTT